MAQKQVKVRYRRTMGIGKDRKGPGFETTMDEATATRWAANGRVEIIASGREKARATAENPTSAPQSGSPAGSGAVSSSSLQALPLSKPESKKRGRPPKPKDVNPFG